MLLLVCTSGCQQKTAPTTRATPTPKTTISACVAAASAPLDARLPALAKACALPPTFLALGSQARAAPEDLVALLPALRETPFEQACPGLTQLFATLGPGVDARPPIIEMCGLKGVQSTTPAANLVAAGVWAHALKGRGMPAPLDAIAEPFGLRR